jgi:hypothetical protein
MTRPGTLALALGLLALSAAEARADVIEFRGAHPIDPVLAKGMCFIEGPHVHSYQPHKAALYVQAPGGWAFVGDPVEFEPDAPKFGYYGHHPLFWLQGGEHYCYITGPHYHWHAPPATLAFKLKGGVHWYVGKHPAWYKARVHKHLDQHYAAIHVVHPVVTVAPPVGFVGVVIGAPGVVIGGPGVHVGWPGFVVGGHPHGKVKVKHGHGWGHYKGRGKGHWK